MSGEIVHTAKEIRPVRHAEKSRGPSSCLLADRVASLAVHAFQQLCPADLRSRYKQTVLATITVQFKKANCSTGETELAILGMGVGTKVLPASLLREERHFGTEFGRGDRRIRDMHAEILAKRSFQRYLLEELQRWKTAGFAGEHVLFQVVHDNTAAFVTVRPDVHFHLYTSSQPCGNACIKRWASSKKAKVHDALSSDQFPSDPHEALQVTARGEGQVALLTKRNDAPNREQESTPPHTATKLKDESNILRHASGICHPVGTSPLAAREGNVMTCSDKIAKWNVLGLQGSVLSQLIPQPVYLSTITVGRKFSEVHCRRALCCRVAKFPPTASFHCNHPSMLGSSVKFDDSAIAVQESESAQANFDVFSCFCAWPTTSNLQNLESVEVCLSDLYGYEVVDGHCGVLESPSTESLGNSEDNPRIETIPDHLISKLSSFSLGKLAQTMMLQMNLAVDRRPYKDLKAAAVAYQTAKQQLLSDKDLFYGWIEK